MGVERNQMAVREGIKCGWFEKVLGVKHKHSRSSVS